LFYSTGLLIGLTNMVSSGAVLLPNFLSNKMNTVSIKMSKNSTKLSKEMPKKRPKVPFFND